MKPAARHQRGVALLTVLLLVAVMTVLVMSVLDDIRFGIRRASNAQAVAQAQRLALGAEALARARIEQLARVGDGRTTNVGDWDGKTLAFPVEGGLIRARLHDRSTCFNLNSVVEGAPEQWQRRELGAQQFIALLQALDFPAGEAAALADSLVDWIDSDQSRSARGAEDAHYLALTPGYRSAGALLAEPSELRAIAGFDAASYARLRPYVCALPDDALTPVNVNMLAEDDGPIVAMLTLGQVEPEAARSMIAARPAGGWRNFEAFFALLTRAGFIAPQPVINQVQLRTRYFGLHAQVEYGDAQVVLSALLEHSPSGELHLLARRWSENE